MSKYEIAQKKYSIENFKDKFIAKNLIINWNDYIVIDKDDTLSTYEFSTNLYSTLSLVKEEAKKTKKNRDKLYSATKVVASVDTSGSVRYRIIKYLGNNKNKLKDISIQNLQSFQGTISYFNIKGDKLKIEFFDKGVLKGTTTDIQNLDDVKLKEAPIGASLILVFEWVDHYNVAYNMGSGNAYIFYTGSTYEGTYEVASYSGGGYASGGSYHEHFNDPIHGSGFGINTHVEEILIDPSFENTKAECVFNKLNELSEGFKSAIQKFDGDFPVAHLKLVLEDLGAARGITRAPNGNENVPDYVITIALNNNSSTQGVGYRPNLMTAKTIAHEVIHAEMFRKLLSLANQGNINFDSRTKQERIDYLLSIRSSFPGIYDYMRRHKNWQHQQMATHYIKTIADILKEFDNSQHSDQFYNDIAWEGLIYENGNNAIYTWTSKSLEEKNRIKKTIADYINSYKNENCQ